MMKKGKAVYKSGRLTATVDDDVTGSVVMLDKGKDCGVVVLRFNDVEDLRELVRQLRTYEVGQR